MLPVKKAQRYGIILNKDKTLSQCTNGGFVDAYNINAIATPSWHGIQPQELYALGDWDGGRDGYYLNIATNLIYKYTKPYRGEGMYGIRLFDNQETDVTPAACISNFRRIIASTDEYGDYKLCSSIVNGYVNNYSKGKKVVEIELEFKETVILNSTSLVIPKDPLTQREIDLVSNAFQAGMEYESLASRGFKSQALNLTKYLQNLND
jgi:hypothetical protein